MFSEKNCLEVTVMGKIKTLYDNPILTAAVISDPHIDVKNPVKMFPMMMLKLALRDVKKSERPFDCFISVGDTTSRGNETNWDMALECFEKYKNPAKNVILAVGNHDCWNDKAFVEAKRVFLLYFERICGKKQDKTYFSYDINGCKLIFLGNEDNSGCDAQISDEQVDWLKNELDSADKAKPILIFCHQSFNQKHGLPKTWEKELKDWPVNEGGIGEKSDEIEAIVKQYDNVYYFSGHIHMGFSGENSLKNNGYSSFEEDGRTVRVNVPSLSSGNHHGENNSPCTGLIIEVYRDRVILRPRNFRKRKFIESFPIRNSKPYFEKELR